MAKCNLVFRSCSSMYRLRREKQRRRKGADRTRPSASTVANLTLSQGSARSDRGGRLGARYLQRHFAWETNREAVIEMLRLKEGRAEIRARRTTGLMPMRARINAWRDHSRAVI
jgi:hypothetical protein